MADSHLYRQGGAQHSVVVEIQTPLHPTGRESGEKEREWVGWGRGVTVHVPQYRYMYGVCYCVETYSGPALSSQRLSVDCKSSGERKTLNIGKVIAVRPANTLTSRQQVRASAAASEVWVCLTEMREREEEGEEGEGGEKLHVWRETELMNRLSLRRSVATEANC